MTKTKHFDEAGKLPGIPETRLPRPGLEDPLRPRLKPRIGENDDSDAELGKLISEGAARRRPHPPRPGLGDPFKPRLTPRIGESSKYDEELAKLISEGSYRSPRRPSPALEDPIKSRLASGVREDDKHYEAELNRLITEKALPPTYLAALKKQWIREHYDEDEVRIPSAFALTWNDIPSETDPETGETTYEVNSGRYDENGEPNPEHLVLNEPLPANATIIVHSPNGTTVIYKTDDQGRVVSAETKTLQVFEDKDQKMRDGNRTKETKNLKDGEPNDEGGHLIGDQFGGCSQQINLVPMSREVNRSAYGNIERTMAKAINEGKKVTDVKVEVTYEGDSKRPTGFKVSYKIDGKPYTTVISHN